MVIVIDTAAMAADTIIIVPDHRETEVAAADVMNETNIATAAVGTMIVIVTAETIIIVVVDK